MTHIGFLVLNELLLDYQSHLLYHAMKFLTLPKYIKYFGKQTVFKTHVRIWTGLRARLIPILLYWYQYWTDTNIGLIYYTFITFMPTDQFNVYSRHMAEWRLARKIYLRLRNLLNSAIQFFLIREDKNRALSNLHNLSNKLTSAQIPFFQSGFLFNKSVCFESPKRSIHLNNKPKLIKRKNKTNICHHKMD